MYRQRPKGTFLPALPDPECNRPSFLSCLRPFAGNSDQALHSPDEAYLLPSDQYRSLSRHLRQAVRSCYCHLFRHGENRYLCRLWLLQPSRLKLHQSCPTPPDGVSTSATIYQERRSVPPCFVVGPEPMRQGSLPGWARSTK